MCETDSFRPCCHWRDRRVDGRTTHPLALKWRTHGHGRFLPILDILLVLRGEEDVNHPRSSFSTLRSRKTMAFRVCDWVLPDTQRLQPGDSGRPQDPWRQTPVGGAALGRGHNPHPAHIGPGGPWIVVPPLAAVTDLFPQAGKLGVFGRHKLGSCCDRKPWRRISPKSKRGSVLTGKQNKAFLRSLPKETGQCRSELVSTNPA